MEESSVNENDDGLPPDGEARSGPCGGGGHAITKPDDDELTSAMGKLHCSAVNAPDLMDAGTSSLVGSGDTVAGPSRDEKQADSPTMIKIGTLGEKCHCWTNFVRLKQTAPVPVFEYLVSFKPALESMRLKMTMVKQLEKVIGPVSNFDGHTLYLPFKINEDVVFVKCLNTKTDTEVDARIKFVGKMEFKDLCNFYNILFQRVLRHLGFLEIKNGYYEACELRELPDYKLQVWPGISLNVEVKDTGVVVMMETPGRVQRSDTVHDFYKAMKNANTENYKKKFENFIIGKIVRCVPSQVCYKIDDVDWNINPTSEFAYKGDKISYKDYFKQRYFYNMKDLEQPMLITKLKLKNRPGSDVLEEGVCLASLPPETCCLTGLTSDYKDNIKIKGEIARIVRHNPSERLDIMRTIVNRILKSNWALDIFRVWGITLDSDMIEVEGRRIPPPTISFRKDSEGQPASYYFRKACQSCYDAIQVNNFVVLCTANDAKRAHSFLDGYISACTTLEIPVRNRGEVVVVKGNDPLHFVRGLEESTMSSDQPQFVIVILPTRKEDVYRAVKKFCLTVVPIPSQCIVSSTIYHRSIQRVALNVCMQINCKLGGSLWGLKLPLKKTMFIGMDAAHDPTRKNPSIIALVASLNDTSTSYFSRCFPLPIHQEVNTCMRSMFMDALQSYKQKNGHYPNRIIFYRDGGFSQSFDLLRKYEVEPCLEVLKETEAEREENGEEKTQFSYVCVAKRIPQRILLRRENGDVTNPMTGTIVDTSITKPGLYDFYLVSQLCSQGAVSPTHYTVLYETTPTDPDVMQKLSYATTFMYYNWPGAIKVPAVIQYAHKLGQITSRIKEIPSRTMEETLFYL